MSSDVQTLSAKVEQLSNDVNAMRSDVRNDVNAMRSDPHNHS
ncbi:hypothetical protein LTSEINV_2749 [Salmonella enterica subsp. enterica serovar Inverness str. R8-3668]|uniref:Lipoprotein leucine-zipper domain-containing protein n=1 Tax=Salmonella enterica subsp. enterica serovar Inverness str. R8-3668 TaxID=913075 RepID=G5NDM2_SALET|nr:hypothetical protein LTSEINV_2749 [Salmonella enterica subsp. enterica serovar Inverness str. R8-3668]